MPEKLNELTKLSRQISQKLEAAAIQTANARIYYENYQKLLDEAKKLHEENYVPLWNQLYNSETTTKQEQEQLKEMEENLKRSWENLGKAINDLFK